MSPCVFLARMTCKPNSVENGYLSRRIVADTFKRYKGVGGQPNHLPNLAPDGVYIACRVAATAVVSYTAVPPLP